MAATLRIEMVAADRLVLDRFTDHLHTHRAEHDRIYTTLKDIQDLVVEGNNAVMELKIDNAQNRGRDNLLGRFGAIALAIIGSVVTALLVYWLGVG
jgi:hypothetical protein